MSDPSEATTAAINGIVLAWGENPIFNPGV